ncbi:hypothetical protein STRIP9103_08914, partial [Streptomyces ipomoeae 91-03]
PDRWPGPQPTAPDHPATPGPGSPERRPDPRPTAPDHPRAEAPPPRPTPPTGTHTPANPANRHPHPADPKALVGQPRGTDQPTPAYRSMNPESVNALSTERPASYR